MHFRGLVSSVMLSKEQVLNLATAGTHSPYLRRHRAAIIITRVQLVSAVFALLTPLWIVVDAFAFPWPDWGILAVVRLISSFVFLALAWPWKFEKTNRVAIIMLTLMMINPPLFYLVSLPLFGDMNMDLNSIQAIVASLYSLLPFVVVAGLSVFPLTLLEAAAYALPVLALTAFGAAQNTHFTWANYIGDMWLLFLVWGVGMLAGMTQLHYMIALVSRASQDPLTGVFTRRSGGEIIDLQYRMAERQDLPFSVAFFDLDKFKSINDNYGHEEGDEALRMMTNSLREQLRRSDVLVRWGGEEFIAVLANTDEAGARLVVERIMVEWLGKRPDGGPLTASIGLAERKTDGVEDWPHLIELADQRMYKAKKGGRARCVTCGDKEILPTPN